MKTEDILRMAKKARFFVNVNEAFSPLHYQDRELTKHLERFAKLVAQHEREACLKFCDEVSEHFPSSGFVGSYIGNKIRNRGQA